MRLTPSPFKADDSSFGNYYSFENAARKWFWPAKKAAAEKLKKHHMGWDINEWEEAILK